MAGVVKSALPSHLKPAGNTSGDDNGFEKRHHGKTRSHMVSEAFCPIPLSFAHALFGPPFAFATGHGPFQCHLQGTLLVRLSLVTSDVDPTHLLPPSWGERAPGG